MTDHDDRRSPPASGTRADDDHDAQADPGWPQNTEEEADETPPPPGTADALEEEPAVRQAVDDDTSTAAFGEYREEERGQQAPAFLEPTDSDD
ncbi:hypothetical protein [Streptomyces cathayae]|uniref:DUF5709 domain-containing protein n=1 Tax=Streptomyces cathayae TaxID=3031124 RepID=A0ABY8JWM7_9ACTN|nr:hypothetical protein [Streptomyces sp. HUAS 5]WGD40047.1 hypothetical protein PYS65_07795 [Streptomyces sp. HUAS 5]